MYVHSRELLEEVFQQNNGRNQGSGMHGVQEKEDPAQEKRKGNLPEVAGGQL